METTERLNDLDYCYASWELLKALEQISYSRNECIRRIEEKINKQQARVIGLLALAFSSVVCGYLLKTWLKDILPLRSEFFKVGTDLIGLLMISVFLLLMSYIIFHALWKSYWLRFLKNVTERHLRRSLLTELENINEKTEFIVSQSIFTENRIPERFLCSEMLPLLIRYFENGQATMIKEAMFYLELELLNTGHYENLIPKITLLQKEKAYLADERKVFEKRVKEGKEL